MALKWSRFCGRRTLLALILLATSDACTTRRECKEFCKLVDRCGFGDGPLGDNKSGASGCMSKCLASSDPLRERATPCVDAAAYDVDVKQLDLDSGWCGQSSLVCESSRECIEQEVAPGFTGVGHVQVVARSAELLVAAETDCEVGYCWDEMKDRVDEDCLNVGKLATADASALCASLEVEYVRVRVGAVGGFSAREVDVDCEGFLRFGASLFDLSVGWVEVEAALHGTQPADLCGPSPGGAYCVELGVTRVVASANETTAAIPVPAVERLVQSVCASAGACD